MTLKVGLTGGIGSGKTLVSNRLLDHGVPIIDTDVIAREVVQPGRETLEKLADQFGKEILLASGELDRNKLREIAFSSDHNKQALDAITHPAIHRETQIQVEKASYPYCVIVVPLLNPSSKFKLLLDRVLTVSCDENVRIQRVIERNSLTREAVLKIMRTQLSDEQREAFADDVIVNDGTKQSALDKTDRLHQKYLALSQIGSTFHQSV